MKPVGPGASAAFAQGREFGPQLFLLSWILVVLIVPYQSLGPGLFDRYVLPALPPSLLLAATALVGSHRSGGATRLAWLCCGLMHLVSLACVQDYMAWNRARWAGIDFLMEERGVPASAIDGGIEFNGRYTLDEFHRRTGTRSFYKQGRFGFWVVEDTYSISTRPRSDRRELKRLPYFSWLGMKQRSLLILEHTNTPQVVPSTETAGGGAERQRESFCGPRESGS